MCIHTLTMKQALKEIPIRQSRDNERPLVENIRLLGRILGDVIREQEGAPVR
jgi:phosphoenolpyruvate carboxylase